MTAILQRLWQKANISKPNNPKKESVTIGNLTVFAPSSDGKMLIKHRCYTIENGGLSSEIANQDRRIMPGIYKLRFSSTKVPLPREYTGRGILLYSEQDPSFSDRRIFIHAGNYPQDTEGCILLQSTYDTSEDPGFGRGSMRAVKTFYDLVTKKGIDSFTLHIRDEFNVDTERII